MRLSFLCGLGITVFLIGCNSFTTDYIPIEPLGVHPNGTVYIGMESCTQCHLDLVNAYMKTSHWLTSSKLNSSNILPFLVSGRNSFDLKIIKRKGSDLYFFLAFFCFSASSIAFCKRAENPPDFLGFFLFSSILAWILVSSMM